MSTEAAAPLQIAIDGPAGSGKTTVARRVADRLQMLYLDTGAMYRAVADAALRTGTDPHEEAALVALCAQQPVRAIPDPQAEMGFRIFTGERELTQSDLESPAVTAIVSTIAAHPRVRAALVQEQRAIAARHPVVMAGRDIGTVVLPHAQCKIFLTASVQARVQRRQAQLREAGITIDADALAHSIEARDRDDERRAVSPLRPADDAHVIDSSAMSIAEVVDAICDCASPRQARGGSTGSP